VSTRDRILRAAIQALVTHGYAGTTARSIAALGGFAPGVLYYHFADLDDVLRAVVAYSSDAREERYRSTVIGVTSAVELVSLLRTLYDEDAASGHIEAVQELVAAARPGSPLALAIAEQTRRWEALAEQVLRTLLRGKPLARMVNIPIAARAAVAYYIGMQTLTHVDQDTSRPRAAFDQAARLAVAFDRIPRLRRRTSPAPPAEEN
jgi:AcrR family transcriptional regulator